jgi:CRISPR-associated protein Cmr3
MNTLLLEPTDVLFFRDAIPMSAGQGRGAGARLPFPSTLHDALRSCLLLGRGVEGLAREKMWTQRNGSGERPIATRDFQSLHTAGPFPWTPEHGLLLPVPLDAVLADGARRVACLALMPDDSPAPAADFRPRCIPAAVTRPDKKAQLHGWWTCEQYAAYLTGAELQTRQGFTPIHASDLWQEEARVGVAIAPETASAVEGQLYAGGFLRPAEGLRIALQAGLGEKSPAAEHDDLARLDWLLLGGERRLARIHRPQEKIFAAIPGTPTFTGSDPCLVKWTLVTPAIFTHGALPGWCFNAHDGLPTGRVRLGAAREQRRRRARAAAAPLPGRAHLLAWCLGKPLTVAGWDAIAGAPKPTQLAVPAGSAYYFLCEDAATAEALAARLHWRPRSDHAGDRGCGYGLCSLVPKLHEQSSADLPTLARELFSEKTPALSIAP